MCKIAQLQKYDTVKQKIDSLLYLYREHEKGKFFFKDSFQQMQKGKIISKETFLSKIKTNSVNSAFM